MQQTSEILFHQSICLSDQSGGGGRVATREALHLTPTTSRWEEAAQYACSNESDGEYGSRSESDGTWSRGPFGCAPGAF